MNVSEFVAKWKGSDRSERAASQEHFIDLCQLLGAPTPNEDPTGETYAFEKGAEKTGVVAGLRTSGSGVTSGGSTRARRGT